MPPVTARFLPALALAASGLLALPAGAHAATAAGSFTPVDPFRLLDTRTGVGAAKTPVKAGQTVTFAVAGRGGVPASNAGAVVLNVTVTRTARGGFVTAFPAGTSRPNASNLNVLAGQTVANHVTVRLGAGQVSLYNGTGGSVDLIADIAGWYRSGVATAAGTFTPTNPTRLLDTRSGIGSSAKPLAANKTRAFAVGGQGGIPSSGVGAAAFNLTATRPTAAGYFTGYASGTARPAASNLNFTKGQTIPNAANLQVGADGGVTLFNGSAGTTHAIADVAGWFRSGFATEPGAYTPVAPARLLDTRSKLGTSTLHVSAGKSVTLTVAGRGGAPASGAAAAVLNVTVTGARGSGFATAYPTGSARPGASNLNFTAGQTVANLVTVKLGSGGKVNLYNGSGRDVDFIADLAGWYRAAALPSQVLDLTNWKLTLPVDDNGGSDGDADEIKQPALNTFQDPAWFHLNDVGDGVVFRANAGGATTPGSEYPRSELREMVGSGQAAWSNTSGIHTMTITQAIMHRPEDNDVVAGQIHGGDATGKPVVLVRLDGSRLYVDLGSTPQVTPVGDLTLNSNYQLGSKFTVRLEAAPNLVDLGTGIRVSYWPGSSASGAPTKAVDFTGSTANTTYFKAGCYTQSSDSSDGYGEVVIHALSVQHS